MWGLRCLVASSLGYTPFEIAFKQVPLHEFSSRDLVFSAEDDKEQYCGEVVDALLATWSRQRLSVVDQLKVKDDKMAQEYEKKVKHAAYVFEEGDQVYMKQRRRGKLLPKALGPYTFMKYKGVANKAAVVMNSKGRLIDVSVT